MGESARRGRGGDDPRVTRFREELLCYTPEEFDRKRDELGVVRTAVEEGFDPREG